MKFNKLTCLKIVAIASLFAFFSCKKSNSSYFDAIVKTDIGIFRGVEIGQTIEEVRSKENEKFLKDDMPEYLYYDYNLDEGNSYTISYDFSENKLYEIELSVYFDQIDDAKALFTELNNFYCKKYGLDKIATDGYSSWQSKSNKTGNNFEVAMINDSKEYGYISLLISDLNY